MSMSDAVCTRKGLALPVDIVAGSITLTTNNQLEFFNLNRWFVYIVGTS